MTDFSDDDVILLQVLMCGFATKLKNNLFYTQRPDFHHKIDSGTETLTCLSEGWNVSSRVCVGDSREGNS